MERLTNSLPFTNSKTSLRTVFSYIFDYAIIFILAAIYAALDKIVTPFAQRFSLLDVSIQYPYSFRERIPIAEAIVISGLVPLVIIAIYTLLIDGVFSHSKRKGVKKYTFTARLWELNCGLLGLFLAQGAAFCITGTLKNLIGRPRPDMLSRCRPPMGASDPPVFGLSTRSICTQTDASIMQDAFRSFPSGHSSSSFAGLGYLSLYLAGKLHVLDQRGEVWRTVIVVIPLAAASCIAASRIMDYRHHAFDVLFGSALGLLCAWASYRQYFPALSEVAKKGRAYPMREWGVPINKIHGPGGDDDDGYTTTGYTSARVDRTTGIMARHGTAEELAYNHPPQRDGDDDDRHQSYGLEPMRRTTLKRDRYPSPGFENATTSGEEMDYEVVRSRAQGGGGVGTGDLSTQIQPTRTGSTTAGGGGNNVFREQMNRIRQQRRPGDGVPSEDEEDIGVGHRGLLVSSSGGKSPV